MTKITGFVGAKQASYLARFPNEVRSQQATNYPPRGQIAPPLPPIPKGPGNNMKWIPNDIRSQKVTHFQPVTLSLPSISKIQSSISLSLLFNKLFCLGDGLLKYINIHLYIKHSFPHPLIVHSTNSIYLIQLCSLIGDHKDCVCLRMHYHMQGQAFCFNSGSLLLIELVW